MTAEPATTARPLLRVAGAMVAASTLASVLLFALAQTIFAAPADAVSIGVIIAYLGSLAAAVPVALASRSPRSFAFAGLGGVCLRFLVMLAAALVVARLVAGDDLAWVLVSAGVAQVLLLAIDSAVLIRAARCISAEPTC